ncbi:hypothetical protein V1478_016855, partial [Vespula squamosa]
IRRRSSSSSGSSSGGGSSNKEHGGCNFELDSDFEHYEQKFYQRRTLEGHSFATIKRRRKSDLRGARKTAKRVLLRVGFLDEAAGGGRLQNIDMENSGDGHGNCHWSDFIGFLVEAFGIGTATAPSRDKTATVFADQFSFTFVEEASEIG